MILSNYKDIMKAPWHEEPFLLLAFCERNPTVTCVAFNSCLSYILVNQGEDLGQHQLR